MLLLRRRASRQLLPAEASRLFFDSLTLALQLTIELQLLEVLTNGSQLLLLSCGLQHGKATLSRGSLLLTLLALLCCQSLRQDATRLLASALRQRAQGRRG